MTSKQILSNHREIDILLERKFQGLFLFRTRIEGKKEEERKMDRVSRMLVKIKSKI